jgi:hypothetical protein
MGVCCSDRQDIEDNDMDYCNDLSQIKKVILKRREEAVTEFQTLKQIALANHVRLI